MNPSWVWYTFWVGANLLLERSEKKLEKQGLCVFFGQHGRQGMILLLGMRCCPYNQSSFFLVCLLWSKSKMYKLNGPSTLAPFIDCVCSG